MSDYLFFEFFFEKHKRMKQKSCIEGIYNPFNFCSYCSELIGPICQKSARYQRNGELLRMISPELSFSGNLLCSNAFYA